MFFQIGRTGPPDGCQALSDPPFPLSTSLTLPARADRLSCFFSVPGSYIYQPWENPAAFAQPPGSSDPRGLVCYRPKAKSEKLEFFHKLKQIQSLQSKKPNSSILWKSYFHYRPCASSRNCSMQTQLWLRGISPSLPPASNGPPWRHGR